MYREEPDPGEKQAKAKPTLTRLGCFPLFLICFFGTFLIWMLLFHTALSRQPECETPDEAESAVVYDPCGILLPDDARALRQLAAEVAKEADCHVAVMFVDEQFTNFWTLYDSVMSEWDPPRGVLLMFGLNNGVAKMAVTGDGWRLANWDQRKLSLEVRQRMYSFRGEAAKILLTEFKRSLEAAKTGDLPETDAKDPTGTLLSCGEEMTRGKYTAGVWGFGAGLILLGVGWLVLGVGRATYRRRPDSNSLVMEEYELRLADNPKLELRDANAPFRKPFGCLHHPALKILAIAAGTLIGFAGMATVWMDKPSPDSTMTPDMEKLIAGIDEAIPDTPSGAVVDLAGAFSEEEERMLEATVAHLEAATGGQVRILTVQTIGSEPLEDYTLEVASKWKIGKAGKDNGALLFLAIQDHRNRIEVGYGWEERLNDARCGDLLRSIVPDLRAEHYAEGCAKVIRGMETYLTGEQADEAGKTASKKKTPRETVMVYPEAIHAAPDYDPRDFNPIECLLGLLGALFALLGAGMWYWGRVLANAVPQYYIFDPTVVTRRYGSSDDSGSDYDYDSGSDYDSDYDSGGGSDSGGSFGGGGASGSW